jgi:XTP/dITP diphosphohydrolase
MILYFASANPGKLREFREPAGACGILVEAVPGIKALPPCEEDGASFEENARKKALHYSAYVDGLVFADDSGISVDALGGLPGVYSARFAGREADDEANNQKLLTELRKLEEAATTRFGQAPERAPFPRSARYACVIALAKQGRILTVVQGRADGVIIDKPCGTGGFGYDPLFFYPPLGKTFAELSPADKFAVSHRGAAFRRLLDYLAARQRMPNGW